VWRRMDGRGGLPVPIEARGMDTGRHGLVIGMWTWAGGGGCVAVGWGVGGLGGRSECLSGWLCVDVEVWMWVWGHGCECRWVG
jgi:hypothetical protein